MFLKDLFVKAIPEVAKGAASVVKDHKGKVSSKRVFSVLGGGSLITIGLGIIEQGVSSNNDKQMYVGLAMIGLGVVAGYLAAFNIKEISNGKD